MSCFTIVSTNGVSPNGLLVYPKLTLSNARKISPRFETSNSLISKQFFNFHSYFNFHSLLMTIARQNMLKHSSYYLLFLWCLLMMFSCEKEPSNALFTKLSNNQTGIKFRNLLKETENFNIFKYQYFNNGGGLAVGDFNNDGLQDLVFTGNMVKNRLYINQGDLQFEDVTKKSGIADKEGWCTGATTVDINEDGWLDLYICRAGYPFDDLRSNLLFINNRNLTFTEKSADYGLDDLAYSTHSAFFDYDKDGDLDFFLLNHSTVEYSRGSLEVFQLKNKKNPDFTNKLFRNDGGKFVNVTKNAGIHSNVLTFSLGISIADLNNDGWQDIFIGNDFNEPDYLFINQQDGTFKDEFGETFDHTAMFSMGSDIADFNNDGLLDIVNLDMLPESNYLQKMHSGVDNYDKISQLEKSGFHNQYSRNMLQLNNGDGTFSEIGQMAGVSNTDWSWAPLFFDFDNDGNKDLFIANGYIRDHTDMDFLNFTANEVVKIQKGKDHVDFDGYMEQMPPILLPNYFYQNIGNLQFENQTAAWGLDNAMISQSAAYADLDNDGDLDLVLNNTDSYAAVYRNNTNQLLQNNYLRLQLKGRKNNPLGIGTKVSLYTKGEIHYQEQQPIRGFQSSIDPILNFGLGKTQKIDSIEITWTTDERQVLKNIEVNQLLEVNIENASQNSNEKQTLTSPFFTEKTTFEAQHQESNFNDFNIQPLIPWFYSRQGPPIAVGDVNKDGLEDVYIGNAKGASGKLLIQQKNGAFPAPSNMGLEKNIENEDSDAAFFDANGDGYLDLYIASGSYEFSEKSYQLKDCLYLNDGKGNLSKSEGKIPAFTVSTTCVKPADLDGDGDMDVFLGGGYIYGQYPIAYPSRLLINDGKGIFKEQKIDLPTTRNINDAVWIDLNGDNFPELITVGEWARILIFENNQGTLSDQTDKYFSTSNYGLWNTIHAADFDQDGDQDLVVGNLGNNSQLSASPTEPLELFYGDFDKNGGIDPLLCYYVDGKSYPFISRDDLLGQLPHLKKKFLFFKDYANAQIQDILTPEQLEKAQKLQAFTLETTYFENQNGSFIKKTLPAVAQIAPVYAIESLDVNNDGHLDLILGGNHTHTRVKLGRLDGNHGVVLLGNGKGDFRVATYSETGLKVRGETRQIEKIEIGGKTHILFGVNDETMRVFEKKALNRN